MEQLFFHTDCFCLDGWANKIVACNAQEMYQAHIRLILNLVPRIYMALGEAKF